MLYRKATVTRLLVIVIPTVWMKLTVASADWVWAWTTAMRGPVEWWVEGEWRRAIARAGGDPEHTKMSEVGTRCGKWGVHQLLLLLEPNTVPPIMELKLMVDNSVAETCGKGGGGQDHGNSKCWCRNTTAREAANTTRHTATTRTPEGEATAPDRATARRRAMAREAGFMIPTTWRDRWREEETGLLL